MRESPALYIIEGLRKKGAEVVYSDPHVPVLKLESGEEMGSVELSDAELAGTDCAVVATAHSKYDFGAIGCGCDVVVDTRNALGR